MSITLNNQIHGSSYARQQQTACGCSMLCNQVQGEHTLILRSDIRILSYFRVFITLGGYLKPF
jgi:hypothetical protein